MKMGKIIGDDSWVSIFGRMVVPFSNKGIMEGRMYTDEQLILDTEFEVPMEHRRTVSGQPDM